MRYMALHGVTWRHIIPCGILSRDHLAKVVYIKVFPTIAARLLGNGGKIEPYTIIIIGLPRASLFRVACKQWQPSCAYMQFV
jgi:hypothetical protein